MDKKSKNSILWRVILGGILLAIVFCTFIIIVLNLIGYEGFAKFERLNFFSKNKVENPDSATSNKVFRKDDFSDIRCFKISDNDEKCILFVNGKWYVVSDILRYEDVPEKFKFLNEDNLPDPTLP